MSEAAIIEQVSWLAEHQRTHCNGVTAMTTFQGVRSDEIVLPQSVADHPDPAQLILACDALVDALQNEAYLLPGEYALEMLYSYYAHDYLKQAKGGGHAQYFVNRGNDELAIRSCSAALKSMLADPHLDLFNRMVRLHRASPEAARKIAKQAGYRNADAALRDLDAKLAALEEREPLMPRQKMWLRSLRKLKLVPDAEMDQHLNRIASTNALYGRRKAEAEQARAEHVRDDPTHRAVKALCDMAGLQFMRLHVLGFAPMRQAWPEGPKVHAYVLRADTNRGARAAVFYTEGRFFKRRLAVLVEQGGGLPLGSLSLTRAEQAQIVPPPEKRKRA